jgi:23S rRNA (adenine2503-C2)-methyltransferase
MISEELRTWFLTYKQPPFRLKQVESWVYQKGVTDFRAMSNLPEELRETLAESGIPLLSLRVISRSDSEDKQTTKVGVETQDHKVIEMVIMRHKTGRVSLCVSSQAGCVVGCAFCATGQLVGVGRNLTTAEIVDQVIIARGLLLAEQSVTDDRLLPTNVVFMGMGEPFYNFDEVMAALIVLEGKLQIGGRRLTVSTSGVAPKIIEFAKLEKQINLAVSLHSATDSMRSHLMPINDQFDLATLRRAIEEYMKETHKKVFFEYVMLSELNDTPAQAEALIKWLPPTLSHVNLIPYNAVPGTGFETSSPKRIEAFRKILVDAGIPVTVRHTLGDDIDASCGQLAAKSKGRKKG